MPNPQRQRNRIVTVESTGRVIRLPLTIQQVVINAINGIFDGSRIPVNSRIAITFRDPLNPNRTNFIVGEIESMLLDLGHNPVERGELDILINEQMLSIGWEFDEKTAALIGRFLGAEIMITGRIEDDGTNERLRLRALCVSRGNVLGSGYEWF